MKKSSIDEFLIKKGIDPDKPTTPEDWLKNVRVAPKKKKAKKKRAPPKLPILNAKYILSKYDLEQHRGSTRRLNKLTLPYSVLDGTYEESEEDDNGVDGDGYIKFSLQDGFATMANNTLAHMQRLGIKPEDVIMKIMDIDYNYNSCFKYELSYYKETPESDKAVITRLLAREKQIRKMVLKTNNGSNINTPRNRKQTSVSTEMESK